MQKIKKAILPVAGFGTRFLPATKAQPKEMLPIVDKPIIQYLVEEAVESGIEEIIFVTGRGKRVIEDHFDYSFELEYNLVEKKKRDLLEEIYKIPKLAKFTYVRQPKPLGDGHALLCARHLVGNEPVAVLFGDDLVYGNPTCLKQLMNTYDKYGDSVVALTPVSPEEVSRFGVVSSVKLEDRVHQIKDIVEKPAREKAPSNLIIVGKYIITPDVFEELGKMKKPEGNGDEIRLADALKNILKRKPVYGNEFIGKRYDCGSKLGFLEATVDYALRHKEVKDGFKAFLERINSGKL